MNETDYLFCHLTTATTFAIFKNIFFIAYNLELSPGHQQQQSLCT